MTYKSTQEARRAYIVSKKTQKAIDKRESAKVKPEAEPKKTKAEKVELPEE